MITKFKKYIEQINEYAGVSFEVRAWSKEIFDILQDPNLIQNHLIIDKNLYPEAFKNAYDKFKVDYFVIEFTDDLMAYSTKDSGYDEDDNYVVFLFMPRKIEDDDTVILNHELKHAFQDWKLQSSGNPGLYHSKEMKELYTNDFSKIFMEDPDYPAGIYMDILIGYYYVSEVERAAFIENVYDKYPKYESNIRELTVKDFTQYYDDPNKDSDWELLRNYDIPFLKKFKSADEFLIYSEEHLKHEAYKILKKISKVRYLHKK